MSKHYFFINRLLTVDDLLRLQSENINKVYIIAHITYIGRS